MRTTLFAAFLSLCSSLLLAVDPPPKYPPADFYGEGYRLIFHAVMDGCMNDGLDEEDIEAIIPLHEESGRRKLKTNFVIACPACSPAYDAFNLYAKRDRLLSQGSKMTNWKSFGTGLDAATKAELQKPGKPCRDAIQGLITKWIDARIELLRLTEDEEKAIREDLAARRKKGEESLKMFQNGTQGGEMTEHYRDWKECAICSGAAPSMGGTKKE